MRVGKMRIGVWGQKHNNFIMTTNGLPQVWTSILDWNGGKDILACVNSLQALDCPHFRIVISDNGSTDGSDERLSRLYPKLEIRRNGVNLGFSAGNNRILRAAMDCAPPARPTTSGSSTAKHSSHPIRCAF